MVDFEPGQDDEIGVAGDRLPGPDEHELDVGLEAERIEIVEIGDARQASARRS